MRPFNLIEATVHNKPVVTRSGRKVIKLAHFPNASPYVIVAQIEGNAGVQTFTAEGKFFRKHLGMVSSSMDLFMQPQKYTGYVNVWLNEDHGLPFLHASVHPSLVAAIAERTTSWKGYKKTLVKRFEVEYEL